MKNIVKITVIILGVLFNMSAVAVASDTYVADTVNGAQVWAETCMRCHNVRPPADVSSRAWSFYMSHMRVRAGLTGQETRDILAFILASKRENDKD